MNADSMNGNYREKIPDPDIIPWWKRTVVYQIYPRSFKDASGNGIGDLKGVIEKLDYLVELGIETVWFSPFYPSPQCDFGYDISDYRNIDPVYGNMEIFDTLVEEMHERGLKIVLDMVLNHTSDKHPWFLESRKSKDNPKADWYVWHDGRKKGKKPPNNWKNVLGSSGWHFDPVRKQYYLAQFLPCQPDLNYWNPEVRKEMLDIVRFWCRKKVDGFRLDMINALFEDKDFRDNPFSWRLLPSDNSNAKLFQDPKYTLNHPETLKFMKELRKVIDEFSDPQRFMVGEVSGPLPVIKSYLGEKHDGLNLVFAFQSMSVPLKAKSVRKLIKLFEETFPEPFIPTWVFSNHDRIRRISRFNGNILMAKANTAFQLTVRGVPFIYYGEEVGMEQHKLPIKEALDPVARMFAKYPQFIHNLVRKIAKESVNRDECRTPMQWDDSPNAGFCPPTVKPWLPVTPSYPQRNVKVQSANSDSLLACYRRFLEARRNTPALYGGDLVIGKIPRKPGELPEEADRLSITVGKSADKKVLYYKRRARVEAGIQRVHVLINLSWAPIAFPNPAPNAALLVGTSITTNPVRKGLCVLTPWEGIVLSEIITP